MYYIVRHVQAPMHVCLYVCYLLGFMVILGYLLSIQLGLTPNSCITVTSAMNNRMYILPFPQPCVRLKEAVGLSY